MMKTLKRGIPVCAAVATALAFAPVSDADLLVQLDDADDNDGATSSSDPLPAVFTAAGLSSSSATQVGLGDFSNTGVWPIGTWGNAFDPNQYITVTITPDAGNTINFTDATWDKGFFGAGMDDGTIRTSLDGFAADVATGSDDGFEITYDLSGLGTVASEIEFRLYFVNDGSPSAFTDLFTNGVNDGWVFNGTVVPEPGSLALLGLGGLAMLRRRRP